MSIAKNTLFGLLLGAAITGASVGNVVAASAYRVVAGHGSWVGMASASGVLVVDRFNDDTKFAMAFYNDGKRDLLMTSPGWTLRPGQTLRMTVAVDGEVYSGTAVVLNKTDISVEDVATPFLKAIYNGRQAKITIGTLVDADMTTLADAATTINETVRYLKADAE